MRWLPALAGAVLALLAAPAMAQSGPDEALAGVWRGTVGELPVTLCLDRQENRQ